MSYSCSTNAECQAPYPGGCCMFMTPMSVPAEGELGGYGYAFEATGNYPEEGFTYDYGCVHADYAASIQNYPNGEMTLRDNLQVFIDTLTPEMLEINYMTGDETVEDILSGASMQTMMDTVVRYQCAGAWEEPACADTMWTDEYGDDCSWYSDNADSCGYYGEGAWDECCACGGGVIGVGGEWSSSEEESCMNDDSWADSYGDSCDWYDDNADSCGAYGEGAWDACCACGGDGASTAGLDWLID